ncbi:hypothetical protein [Winogradskyella undariae]|uniref:hypothetical protein n=1 Tax=Winogradskyella undariae TaxID=1285465 RepID=UPI0015C769F9|nr:hypothetical protein [Winogradskyella undariae]
MYLNNLNNDEKNSFLELAKFISEVDGVTSFEEILVINQYLREMGFNEDFKFQFKSLNEIIKSFEYSSLKNKKIVLFEMLVLVYSDNKFCIREEEVINLLVESFNINKEDYKELVDLTNGISLNLKKVSKVIFE